MILIEQTQVPDTALPVAEFRDHLQLGSGFADDGLQDAVLISQLRAAIASIEGEIGKALLRRVYRYSVDVWKAVSRLGLPIAPVSSITTFRLVDAAGQETVLDTDKYVLVEDTHRPCLKWLGWVLPTIPSGGHADVIFEAGMASDWAGLPANLQQAVLALATNYYEHRAGRVEFGIPASVLAMLRPHRPMRLLGGGEF